MAILFLAGENHVSDKHISSHADVGVCVTVCVTVRVFLSAANCVPDVNGASGGIQWGLSVIEVCIQVKRGTDAVTVACRGCMFGLSFF